MCVCESVFECVWLGVSEWVRVCLVVCEGVGGQLGVGCYVCKLTARIIYFTFVYCLQGCVFSLFIM